MATLYSTVQNKYGLNNSRDIYNKQKEIYNNLGGSNKYGNYTGSYNQNVWLMNQSNAWDRPVQTPTPYTSSNTLAQKYANAVLPDQIVTPTKFGDILPQDLIINNQAINDFAYSQVNPEVDRLKNQANRELMNNIASTGGLRFGTSNVRRQDLSDTYERQRKEMAQPFIDQGLNRLTDYYNELETEYYKDPQAFEFSAIDPAAIMGGGDFGQFQMVNGRLVRVPTSLQSRLGGDTSNMTKLQNPNIQLPIPNLKDRYPQDGNILNPVPINPVMSGLPADISPDYSANSRLMSRFNTNF